MSCKRAQVQPAVSPRFEDWPIVQFQFPQPTTFPISVEISVSDNVFALAKLGAYFVHAAKVYRRGANSKGAESRSRFFYGRMIFVCKTAV
jgi:hypothetical protein